MGWIQELHDTYNLCAGASQFENDPLLPVGHSRQQAHIEVVLDQNGNFLRAESVPKEETVIPVTEESAGRTMNNAPHPLCDKVQYCAGDYAQLGGTKKPYFESYVKNLESWHAKVPHPKTAAILTYLQKRTLAKDLIENMQLFAGSDGLLITEWKEDSPPPALFKMLTAKEGLRDQGDAFIRWRVQDVAHIESKSWEDKTLHNAWIQYQELATSRKGLCLVTGNVVTLAENHPKRLRHSGDGAKLVSTNDKEGYTFRGRFQKAEEAYGIGTIVTQKAHNALRWLIKRQGYQSDGQVFVAWEVGGAETPSPWQDTAHIFGIETEETPPEHTAFHSGDAGELYALRLNKAIAGYRAKLTEKEKVIVMGLDAATPGRMAITYYRELGGAEFLDRITAWHQNYAWTQNYGKKNKFIGAPAPRDIAEAAYGKRIDDKLRKATVERLLPCIIDSAPTPRNLVDSVIHRVCNRVGLENWEWEKCLGIACALIRGRKKDEKYQMALEETRKTRDYLFGRLLAIADHLESRALHAAGEQRDTNAAKLMQRFANHPTSTWRTLELAITPSKARLRSNRPTILLRLEKLLDAVHSMFSTADFNNDSKLTGEFLLAFHCQRAALWVKDDSNSDSETEKGEE